MRRRTAVLSVLAAICLTLSGTAAAATNVVIQPSPSSGNATYLSFLSAGQSDANWGRYKLLRIGTSAGQIRRPIVQFNLDAIPARARILSAQLSLWELNTLRGSGTVEVRRLTNAWTEGSGVNEPTGDGATWIDRLGTGTPWTAPGGDFNSRVAASLNKAVGDSPRWDTFGVTGLVKAWVSGRKPNHGVLLRLSDESFSPCTTIYNCSYWSYASDDWADPTLRPKLTVTYYVR